MCIVPVFYIILNQRQPLVPFIYMIGLLEGSVRDIRVGSCIVLTHGVGYIIYTTPATIATLTEGASARFYTHLIVRENALDIYGFTTDEERAFFELLMRVSGVGPKSAIAILSLADTNTLSEAIASGDVTYLTKVSGIGKKLAQKIVIELKDKLPEPEGVGSRTDDASVLEALEAMGYTTLQARTVIKNIPHDISGLNARVAHALQLLGR